MSVLRVAMSNRALARLEAVWGAATLGRWALTILIALYAYRQGGASAVGVAALVRLLPGALAAPWLSVVVDRSSRRQVLLISSLIRFVLVAAMTTIVLVNGSLALLLVFAVAFTVADTAQKPAQAALFPLYARDPQELAAANAIWSMLDNGGFLAGSLLVGALVSLAGLTTGFAACALPFALASALSLGLPVDVPLPPIRSRMGIADLAEAGRAIGRHTELRLLLSLFGADMLVQGMIDVLIVVAAIALLGLGQQGAGWLSGTWGVGGLGGGVAATLLLARGRLARGVTIGFVLVGLPLVAIGAWPHAGFALSVMVVLGLGFGMAEVALLTLTQRLVPTDLIARVYGAQETLAAIGMAIGAILASALVALFAARSALFFTGALLPLLVLALLHRLSSITAGVAVPKEAFAVLRATPIFAPLPIATVETLAVRARREHAPAGTEIVREGDPGHTFYVIVEGRVDVFEHGIRRRSESDGEYFGEIALLRDVPRTATVRAATAVTLLALDRDQFFAAISTHPRSLQEVEAVTTARLAAGTRASDTTAEP